MKNSFKFYLGLILLFSFISCKKEPSHDNSLIDPKEQSMSKSLDQNGGSLIMEDGTEILVLPGSLNNEVLITVKTTIASKENAGSDLSGAPISQTVSCEPSGLTFLKPITITIPYYPELIPVGIVESDLVITTFYNDQELELASAIDTDKKIISAQISHFSDYRVKVKGNISIESLNIETDGTSFFLGFTFDYMYPVIPYIFKVFELSTIKSANQETWIEVSLFESGFLGAINKLLVAKQLYKAAIVTNSNLTPFGAEIKAGSQVLNKSIYQLGKFPKDAELSKKRLIFDFGDDKPSGITYGASAEVTFNSNSTVEKVVFNNYGSGISDISFVNYFGYGRENEPVDFCPMQLLNTDKKYFFRVNITGNGFCKKSGSFQTERFSISEINSRIKINNGPDVEIISPSLNQLFNYKDEIVFDGKAWDSKDGSLSGNRLLWKSDKDGNLGNGNTLRNETMSIGKHNITLTATDSDNNTGTASTSIIIENVSDNGDFTDSRDNNTYSYCKIGNQKWMTKNLGYLPAVHTPVNQSNTSDRYYVYDYLGTDINAAKNKDNYKKYGVLYNWPSAKKACPNGWHLPSKEEWDILFNYLGGSAIAGRKLKSIDGWIKIHSDDPGNGDNSSGFTAKPGGFLPYDGVYNNLGYSTDFWTSTPYGTAGVYTIWITSENNQANIEEMYPKLGNSVRCIKDQ
ncbi:MAG: hypothetical protein D4R68_08825 [Ignavibacteriales bacterium]|nr:MAG: hypothetical protein D4R68_08825 [Ignavibacteriales bacterium]